LTTITTLLWVLPISLQDEFWAWLGFTMIFGLFAWSALTLTAIPSLYAIFFVSRDRLSYKAMQRAWTISKQQYFSHILPVLWIIMVWVIGFLSSMAEPFVWSILFYIILGITSILLWIASFWLYKKIYKSYNTKPLISSVTLFVRNFITTIMSYILIWVVWWVWYWIIYWIMYLWKLSYSTVEYYWQEVIDWVYGMVWFDLIIIDLSILTSVLSVTLYTIVWILLVYILIKISYAVIDVFMWNWRGIGSLKRSWSYTSNKRRQVFEIRWIQFIWFIVTLLPLWIAYWLYNAFENQYFLLLWLVSLILIILYIPFVFWVDIIFYSNFNNQYIDIKHKRVDK
jgi:hypothetical protein